MHDRRGGQRILQVLVTRQAQPRRRLLQLVLELRGVRVVACDAVIPGRGMRAHRESGNGKRLLVAGRAEILRGLFEKPRLFGRVRLVAGIAAARRKNGVHERVCGILPVRVTELTQCLCRIGAQRVGVVRTVRVVAGRATPVLHRRVDHRFQLHVVAADASLIGGND
jgi:hypothetical protein